MEKGSNRMNYKIITNPGHFFDVVETNTNQIIRTFTAHQEAKSYMRFLNLGGGFDGYTPSFLIKNIWSPTKKSTKVR
jgi:hypothetical protein